MSKPELDRFIGDLRTNVTLQKAVKEKCADRAALVTVANAHGYQFTYQDLEVHLGEHQPEMTEEDLDKIVGGVEAGGTNPLVYFNYRPAGGHAPV